LPCPPASRCALPVHFCSRSGLRRCPMSWRFGGWKSLSRCCHAELVLPLLPISTYHAMLSHSLTYVPSSVPLAASTSPLPILPPPRSLFYPLRHSPASRSVPPSLPLSLAIRTLDTAAIWNPLASFTTQCEDAPDSLCLPRFRLVPPICKNLIAPTRRMPWQKGSHAEASSCSACRCRCRRS